MFYNLFDWREEAEELWSLPPDTGPTEKDLAEVSPQAFAKNAGWNYIENDVERRARVEGLRNHPEEPRDIEDIEILLCDRLDDCLLYLSPERVEDDQGEETLRYDFVRLVYPYVRYLAEDVKQGLASSWRTWRIKVLACRQRREKGFALNGQERQNACVAGDKAIQAAEELLRSLYRELHPVYFSILDFWRRASRLAGGGLLKPFPGTPPGCRLLTDRAVAKATLAAETESKSILRDLSKLHTETDQPNRETLRQTERCLSRLVALAEERKAAIARAYRRLASKKPNTAFDIELEHATAAVESFSKCRDGFLSSEVVCLDYSTMKFRPLERGIIDWTGGGGSTDGENGKDTTSAGSSQGGEPPPPPSTEFTEIPGIQQTRETLPPGVVLHPAVSDYVYPEYVRCFGKQFTIGRRAKKKWKIVCKLIHARGEEWVTLPVAWKNLFTKDSESAYLFAYRCVEWNGQRDETSGYRIRMT